MLSKHQFPSKLLLSAGIRKVLEIVKFHFFMSRFRNVSVYFASTFSEINPRYIVQRTGEHTELDHYGGLVPWPMPRKTDLAKSTALVAKRPPKMRAVKKRKNYLSFGSRPSLVYCQQMSPIRSCTLALAIVTTVIGSSLSWLECRGR